jgi:hypothetical protein
MIVGLFKLNTHHCRMSLRSLTREQSDFVVRFVTDGSVMVRQKQHIYADGKVKEGEIYNVKWGRKMIPKFCSHTILYSNGN